MKKHYEKPNMRFTPLFLNEAILGLSCMLVGIATMNEQIESMDEEIGVWDAVQ